METCRLLTVTCFCLLCFGIGSSSSTSSVAAPQNPSKPTEDIQSTRVHGVYKSQDRNDTYQRTKNKDDVFTTSDSRRVRYVNIVLRREHWA